MGRLLTIIVPTYNRLQQMARLLEDVRRQVLADAVAVAVEIIVGNNGSTDGTREWLDKHAPSFESIRVLHHENNLGPDENFARCVETVRTPYFWIIGDDDFIAEKAIFQVVRILETQNPDLVYLENAWFKDGEAPDGRTATVLEHLCLDRPIFARQVNVWSTFISAIVVRTQYAACAEGGVRALANTNLIQLGWVFKALRSGEKFIRVTTPLVFAMSGNSGGYAVIKVFAVNYPQIVARYFSSDVPVQDGLIRPYLTGYLPVLIQAVRAKRAGNFSLDIPIEDLKKHLGRYWQYWVFVYPTLVLPRMIGTLFLAAAKVFNRVSRIGQSTARSEKSRA